MPRRTRYQWPSSLLGRDRHPTLMADLHAISLRTGLPVTRLLREAAEEYVARSADAMSVAVVSGRAAEPQRGYAEDSPVASHAPGSPDVLVDDGAAGGPCIG